MMISLAPIHRLRDDLKVPGHVESADVSISQRDDVVNLVLDSGQLSYSDGLGVERTHRSLVDPFGRSSYLDQFAVPGIGEHNVSVGRSPIPT